MIVSYTGETLGTCINVKNKTVFNHGHDIVYQAKCPEEPCPHDYVGESGRRVLEQVKDQNGRDTSSHILKDCVAADHQYASCDELKIVIRNYCNNKWKQEITEYNFNNIQLIIKNLKPSLNVQEKSVTLQLFNQLHSLEDAIPTNLNCTYVAMKPFSFKF